MWGGIILLAAVLVAESAGPGAARLVCYSDGPRRDVGFEECTHLVYHGDARGDKLDAILKDYRKASPRAKIVLRVGDGDKDYRSLLKSKHVQGLEIHNAHKNLNRTKVLETVVEARTAITNSGGGPLFLAIPAHPELLAKYYDLRALMKKVDLMMLQTHALGAVKKMTYHPSRLSGLWDMMNTDSVVDLAVGLGVPASKLVISLPATAQQFTLQNETLSTPGSPCLEDEPKEIGQDELCRLLQKGRWTLERDQDLSAPYAFKDQTWIAFEDASSVDVKGKYARVRGLAGLALFSSHRDAETPCGPTLKASLAKVLNQQSRAPRAAILRSLENEILSAPSHARALDALQVSPYRITQIVDSDGVIHSIREDTRTEFSCSRQGYFVHPRSCARFYRCVKFDQLSPEYTVFEFDCPAGLAFDARYEVCVWPGSLPDSQACPGSSEIAPVPRTRFICPEHEGYYADPENCRWFFACLDHGKAPLTAYEFRCPFGLGFDADRLKCDWPWLVPACGNIARYEAEVHGYSGATLTGAAGFQGQTADSINVAAHQSLVSGASLSNHVGIQSGFLNHGDALDSNFITSQEFQNADQYQNFQGLSGFGISQNGLSYQSGAANLGLVQATTYNGGEKYTSGSLILDDYRLPTKKTAQNAGRAQIIGVSQGATGHGYSSSYSAANSAQGSYNAYSAGINAGQSYKSNDYDADNSGAYVHDPTGDTAEAYRHVDSPVEPYIHQSTGYKDSSEYYDYGRYKGSSEGQYNDKYTEHNGHYENDNSGAYVESSSGYNGGSNDNSGAYVESASGYHGGSKDNSGAYVESASGYHGGSKDNSGAYVESAGGYNAGAYRAENLGFNAYKAENSGAYKADNSGAYNAGSNIYKNDNIGAYNVGNSNTYTSDNYGAYNADYSGSYKNDNSGQYIAGVYRTDGHIGAGGAQSTSSVNLQGYSQANAGNYITDSKAYTGSSHTLTAGAINVGLVGKTTLVDVDYINQNNYLGQKAYSQSVSHQTLHPGQVSLVSQPAVSITHVGTDENNLDGYGYVTTPTSSGVPTTATPFAVTTSIPTVTYKTTFLPEEPKSSIRQIFGFSQPAITAVQPTIVAVKQQYVTPQIQVTDYNQGQVYQYESKDYSAVNTNSQSGSSYAGQASGIAKTESGYDYSKPSIKFEDGLTYTTASPAATVSYEPAVRKNEPQGFSYGQQTLHKVESVGFQSSTPTPVSEPPFKKLVAYTTGAPPITTFAQPTVPAYPQTYSHQTLHKIESGNVHVPSVEFAYEQPQTVIQYTTAQPAIVVQPAVSTYQPQVVNQQTLHTVDVGRVNTYSQDTTGYKYEKPAIGLEDFGYKYEKPTVKFEDQQTFKYSTQAPPIVQYSTPVPEIVPSYKPQVYSQQTLHKIEVRPFVTISSTPTPVVHYAPQPTPVTIYQNPILKYTQPKVTPITYVQPTYQPQAYSQQTIHKSKSNIYTPTVQTGGYEYRKPIVYEQPKAVFQYTTPAPAIVSTYQPVVSTYQPAVPTAVPTAVPQVYSHQTSHKVDASQVKTYSEADSGYQYPEPTLKFEDAPQTVQTYSTTQRPAIVAYKPQSFSHQTIHKAEKQFVSSTPLPQVDISYQTPVAPVSIYQNPILKYTQKVTPVTYVKPTATVFTQTYQPIVQQQEQQVYVKPTAIVSTQTYEPIVQQKQVSHAQFGSQKASKQSFVQNVQLTGGYIYEKPEIQSNTARKAYSDASVVSHQTFHLASGQYDSGKDAVFVSTTPSNLVYEDHYAEYEAPKKIETYQAPEYIPPKTEYQQTYSVASSAAPVVQQTYVQTQEQYVKPRENSQTYETVQKTVPAQVSFSTSHVSEPKRIESYHISSFPGTKATINYKQTYENPEIQVEYKAEDYLPPVVSTPAPVVTTNYRPRTYSTTPRVYLPPVSVSTTREYLPPATTKEYLPPSSTKAYLPPSTTGEYLPPSTTTREYLPPAEPEYNEREYLPPIENTYLPPSTTTRKVYRVKSTTPAYQYTESTTDYKAQQYLPPLEQASNVVNFESYGFKNLEATAIPKIRYNQYEEVQINEEVTSRPVQRKPNIVVETAKSNLLGFGTVGPDAGLVSSVTHTTAAPIVISSTSRPIFRSSTQIPSTTYKAPEYLPPIDEDLNIQNYEAQSVEQASRGNYKYQENAAVVSTFAPIRQQNIVVQTAKANLGYSTVDSDIKLFTPSTASTPAFVPSTESYTVAPKRVTTTYTPEEQGLFEVTQAPIRRTKPKVAVVTKINDFNPLLVRKLGAVCSCQSPVLVLKGTRPTTPAPSDFDDDYSSDYDDSGRGDIGALAQKSARIQRPTATSIPVSSTFNPIIVPDDSYYQDYQDQSNFDFAVTPKNEEIIISSTPVSSTQRVVKIRPRVKAVTVAPTYRNVLLNRYVEASSTITPSETVNTEIDSQSFDRYGPGGWRSRDETLQGSVDCKRAGLFRHPKQCNKFYACRWDCTKQRFTLHVFNCPVQLSFDPSLGACNWPSQGPACQGDTLLTNTL